MNYSFLTHYFTTPMIHGRGVCMASKKELSVMCYMKDRKLKHRFVGGGSQKMNEKEEAIKMYKKSVELNPENENSKSVLEEILK